MPATFAAFEWFLWQSTVVGGLGALWFWIPFVAILGAMVWAYQRSEPVEYWKLSLLAGLPLLWIFMGLWGGYFWLDWQKKPFIPNPGWVIYPVKFGLWLFIAYALGMIVYLRGIRLPVALFALLNLYFMLAISFLAGMAVTGNWL